jgi:hypothetical protein
MDAFGATRAIWGLASIDCPLSSVSPALIDRTLAYLCAGPRGGLVEVNPTGVPARGLLADSGSMAVDWSGVRGVRGERPRV